MTNYNAGNIIAPFPSFCCSPSLPTIYGDSFSYYEELCKLSGKVNEIIQVINDQLESMIRMQLDKLFIDAMYDADTETLILQLGMRG